MRDVIIGWLGLVVFVVAVVASLGADFFRQHDTAGEGDGVAASRQPGGRVFWLTVVAVVLTVAAAAFTVVRLTTLA